MEGTLEELRRISNCPEGATFSQLGLRKSVGGLLDQAAEVLRAIPQVILQGPPGTGKTYTAKRLAARLLGIGASAVDEEESKTTGEFHDTRPSEGQDGGCWELVQFHPAYAYDDFVRGLQA